MLITLQNAHGPAIQEAGRARMTNAFSPPLGSLGTDGLSVRPVLWLVFDHLNRPVATSPANNLLPPVKNSWWVFCHAASRLCCTCWRVGRFICPIMERDGARNN